MEKIAVLITCYNRKAKTLSCLDALFRSSLKVNSSICVFLVDDNSSDGTREAVLECYPQVHILKGNGEMYWNGGMRLAFEAAIKKNFDYYLWLNDDTQLYPHALQTLLDVSNNLIKKLSKPSIVVGSTQDESNGKLTYGGMIRQQKWKPTSFSLIAPRDVPVECETMNGNCVLVPKEIAHKVGNLEPGFIHAMGDLDYGLRARDAGYSVWLMPGFAGTCANNSESASYNAPSLPVTTRLRMMLHAKGLPLSSWRIFTQRHAGILWPIYWLWPYVKVIFKGLINK